ncbi:unnamed protein product, partial [Thlaspi arvense]
MVFSRNSAIEVGVNSDLARVFLRKLQEWFSNDGSSLSTTGPSFLCLCGRRGRIPYAYSFFSWRTSLESHPCIIHRDIKSFNNLLEDKQCI